MHVGEVDDTDDASDAPALVPKSAEPAWALEPHDKYKIYPLKSTPILNHPFHKSMLSRDPKEKHRTSTPLEKLFDLTLVVALSAVSDAFATMMQYGDNIFQNFINFSMLFFAIWDAWLPFIWFASTYDVDDVLYRVGAWGQMIGILVVTDGIKNGLSEVIVGYVILRTTLDGFLRIRAAYQDQQHRKYNLVTAFTSLCLLGGWVFLILYSESEVEMELLFFGLASLELSAIAIVRRLVHQSPSYHAHHISERYSEFTIIAFGECIISLSHATTLSRDHFNFQAFAILCESMALLFMLWWFYFLVPFGHVLDDNPKTAFRIGIGHFVIHASLATFATGLYLVARCANGGTGHGDSSPTNTTEPILSIQTASFMVAGPIAVFITSLPIVAGFPPIALIRVAIVGILELLISAFVTPLVSLEILLLLLCIPMCLLLINVIWRGGVEPHLKAVIAKCQTEKSSKPSQVNT